MVKLTPRQQQIFDYLVWFTHYFGYPPTRVEIAKEFRFKSPNAAEDHLKALERAKRIRLVKGISRGIQIIKGAENENSNTGVNPDSGAPGAR